MEFRLSRTRALFRGVLESKFFGPFFRRGILSFEFHREKRALFSDALRVGAKPFTPPSFMRALDSKARADTLFILGSGPSVNQLTEENLKEMHSQRSVGINNWPIHPFVPDFYAFESVSHVGDGRDLSRAFRLLNSRLRGRDTVPVLLLRLRSAGQVAQLEQLQPRLRKFLFYYGRISPATRLDKNLPDDIATVLALSKNSHPGVVVDSGASVVRMVSIGLLLGLRNFVLVGVDLVGNDYFWESSGFFLDEGMSLPANNQSGDVHETMRSDTRPFSASVMLQALSNQVSRHTGGQLYVSSPTSRLATFLPVFPWGCR